MEASALPATVGLPRTRIAIGPPLLRIRSDAQLVSLFRSGSEEAFRAIHDRYRARMLAYARQMLGGCPQDAEDAVQEVFVRAYGGLRTSRRELALRAWLYRIAHNRCIDELRRPHPTTVSAEVEPTAPAMQDPVAKVEQRDALRRLIADVQRLPDQQRSALLMRELAGMPYADVSGALGVSVPAVKSLLVRARVGLAQASEARDTACAEIRDDLILAQDRGARTSGLARRHMRDCSSCHQFRAEMRGVSRHFAVLAPTLGPFGVIANLLGLSGGGTSAAAGGSAVAGGGAAAASGAAGTGAVASAGLLAGGASHVVTLIAAAVLATGGAVELQRTLLSASPHRAHHRLVASERDLRPHVSGNPSGSAAANVDADIVAAAASAWAPASPRLPQTAVRLGPPPAPRPSTTTAAAAADPTKSLPISETLDPDMMYAPAALTTPPTTTGPATTDPSGVATSGGGVGTGTTTTGTGASPAGSPSGAGTTGSGTSTGTGTGTGAPPPTDGAGGAGSGSGAGTSGTSGAAPGSSSATGGSGPDSSGTAGSGTGATPPGGAVAPGAGGAVATGAGGSVATGAGGSKPAAGGTAAIPDAKVSPFLVTRRK